MAAILVPGTYMIPGLGQVVITASLAIFLGKVAVELGTEIFNRVEQGISIQFSKEAEEAKNEIPERLKDGEGNVDLDQFDQNVKGKNAKKEDGGWEIEKDTAGHGGSKWKLKNKKGKRVASLDEKGKVLRK